MGFDVLRGQAAAVVADAQEGAIPTIGQHAAFAFCRLGQGLGHEAQMGQEFCRAVFGVDAFHIDDLHRHDVGGEELCPGQRQDVVLEGQIGDGARHLAQIQRIAERERGKGAQFAFQAFDGGQPILDPVAFFDQAMGHADAGAEFQQIEGLGDIVGGARHEGAFDIVALRHRGQHQDRRMRIALKTADLAAEGDPVHAGHLDIEKQAIEGRRGGRDHAQRFMRGTGAGHPVMPRKRQRFGKQVEDRIVVVDGKYFHAATSCQGRPTGTEPDTKRTAGPPSENTPYPHNLDPCVRAKDGQSGA